MEKNGKLFISIVDESDFLPSVWDPYIYKQNGQANTLSHFAAVKKTASKTKNSFPIYFEAIEYKDIPDGNYLSFSLRKKLDEVSGNASVVGEGELLFGTMRAYLGNILVTPAADWLEQKSPIYFEVKSEFVSISPFDNLYYFWFAYLRSRCFLEHLPLGSGGTRPRLNPKVLSQTPVAVPCLEERKEIHDELKVLAEREWLNCLKIASKYSLANFTH